MVEFNSTSLCILQKLRSATDSFTDYFNYIYFKPLWNIYSLIHLFIIQVHIKVTTSVFVVKQVNKIFSCWSNTIFIITEVCIYSCITSYTSNFNGYNKGFVIVIRKIYRLIRHMDWIWWILKLQFPLKICIVNNNGKIH